MINVNNFERDYYSDNLLLPIAFTAYKPINLENNNLFYRIAYNPAKSISKVLDRFINGGRLLINFSIKNETFLVAKGCIIQIIESELETEFIPMIALCQRKDKYCLLVNKNISNTYLKPLIKKVIVPLTNQYDIIWTNNLNNYFSDLDLPNFKSLKEKKEFLTELVEEFQREDN